MSTLHKIIATVVAIVVLGGGITYLTLGADTAEAREWAEDWTLANVKTGTLQNIDCQNHDSDGDGYVSCTVSVNENGSTKLYPIECAATWPWQFRWAQKGCRFTKVAGK